MRAVREIIGGAVYPRQRAVEQIGRGRRITAADVGELVRLVVPAQLQHLVGDGVERLVPADRHELRIDAAALLRIGPLHRHLDAVRIVGLLRNQMAARAAVAAVGFAQRIAAHAHRAPVLHEDLDRAPLGAALAGRRHPFALGGSGRLGLAPRHRVGCRLRKSETRRQHAAGDDRRLDEIPSCEFHSKISFVAIAAIWFAPITAGTPAAGIDRMFGCRSSGYCLRRRFRHLKYIKLPARITMSNWTSRIKLRNHCIDMDG